MDIERIITRAARRLDIQRAALASTNEEIKVLTGVEGLTGALAKLQVKRDRQAGAIEVTKALVDYYNKQLDKHQGKIK